MSIALLSLVSLTMVCVGVITVLIIYASYGPYAALNSFITFAVSLIAVVVYLSRRVLRVDVVKTGAAPVTNRFNVIVRGGAVCDVLNYLTEFLRGDEFFELRDADIKCSESDGFLHISTRYRGAWGVGVEVSAFASRYDDGVELTFTLTPWSVEELSLKYTESVLRLITSKLVGCVKLWALRQGLQ